MMGREEGAVLLVVLVALALLAALAGVSLRLGHAGLLSMAAEDAAFDRDLAEQSALAAIAARLGDPPDIARNGEPETLTVAGLTVEARVRAAEGLVNPAHARPPVLQALLLAEGASPDQAQRLTRSIVAARAEARPTGPWDVAPLFAADRDLWPKVAPYLTFLGARATVDSATAPPALRDGLTAASATAVDLGQAVPVHGYYEIDLRVLAPGETAATAQGPFTRFSILRDRQGQVHLFARSWPGEVGG